MPIVNINLMEGRSPETIKTVIAEVTETLANVLDIPPDRVRVLVTEVPKTHWGIGGVPASENPGR